MIDRIKTLLGISGTDMDELLGEIIGIITARVCLYVSEETLPAALEYVVVEASVNRFNRIRSEGTTSHTVEGESWSWADDDLQAYRSDLQAWIDAQENKSKGRVRFL